MSPEAICPGCGREQMFHDDEVDSVRAGEAVCMECTLKQEELKFLVEVLEGGHKELIAQIAERLEEERLEKLW